MMARADKEKFFHQLQTVLECKRKVLFNFSFIGGCTMFFNKKENEAEEAFKKQLETVANDPAVKANAALSKLLEAAVKKTEKSESIRSIASNLDTQLRSNFAENELPKAVTSLQLDLARYSAVGANGVVLK